MSNAELWLAGGMLAVSCAFAVWVWHGLKSDMRELEIIDRMFDEIERKLDIVLDRGRETENELERLRAELAERDEAR